MYVGFSLIHTCKVKAKECNISALSIIFYLWAIICVLLKAEPSSYAQQLCVSNNRRTR